MDRDRHVEYVIRIDNIKGEVRILLAGRDIRSGSQPFDGVITGARRGTPVVRIIGAIRSGTIDGYSRCLKRNQDVIDRAGMVILEREGPPERLIMVHIDIQYIRLRACDDWKRKERKQQ